MTTTFDNLSTGDSITGPSFAVSRESIRLFCDGSLDYKQVINSDGSKVTAKCPRIIVRCCRM